MIDNYVININIFFVDHFGLRREHHFVAGIGYEQVII